MKFLSLLSLQFVVLCLWHLSQATIQPAKDARAYFSAEFYRRVVVDLKKEQEDVVVSPAAAQKFLTTIYKGTEAEQADRILFNIGIKHIDMKRLIAECINETGSRDYAFAPHLRRRQMLELAPILDKGVVLKYFEMDLKLASNSMNYENFIVAPGGLNVTVDFKEFAQSYFNTHVVNANGAEIQNIKTKFENFYRDSKNVELYSNVEFKAKIKNSDMLANGQVNAVIEAQYYEDNDRQYIVLPLDSDGLKLFVAIAANPNEFNYFIMQIVGRRLKVFQEFYKEDWKTENVLVHLPAMKFDNVNDLAVHFREVTTDGLKKSLETDAKLSAAFENWPENGTKIEHYWQRVSLDLSTEDKNDAVKGPHTKTFDAIGKNFFYAIYSDKEYFIMGHHIGAA